MEKELLRKEKALSEAAVLLMLRKRQMQSGGPRGRMIPAPDRNEAIALIDEAVSSGAKLNNACKILDLTERTYYRWKK